jgi:parvulin-like peptidyl-prolyl isomerase
MIKKFVSNALLSVFMDKKAREVLKASRAQRQEPNTKPPDPKTVEELENAVVQRAPQNDPMDNMDQDEVAALIRDSLDEAEREIINRKTKKAANPERQALIDQAMAIHRAKRHIVDDLPPEQKEKLMFMALKTLGKPDDNSGNQ